MLVGIKGWGIDMLESDKFLLKYTPVSSFNPISFNSVGSSSSFNKIVVNQFLINLPGIVPYGVSTHCNHKVSDTMRRDVTSQNFLIRRW
jgi:hypothetical protein